MKKLLLILMLAVVSSSAMAEWVEVGTTDKNTVYVDPTTIRKSGNKVKMWVLYDFNSAKGTTGNKYLSEKAQNEYDCKEEQRRLLFFSRYSENMGGGDTVYSANATNKDWSPVAPESISKAMWEFACGK